MYSYQLPAMRDTWKEYPKDDIKATAIAFMYPFKCTSSPVLDVAWQRLMYIDVLQYYDNVWYINGT